MKKRLISKMYILKKTTLFDDSFFIIQLKKTYDIRYSSVATTF